MSTLFTRLSSFVLCICLWILALPAANASHMMGADLRFRCLGGNTYEITLSFYRDCSGISPSTTANISISSASCSQTLATLSLPQTSVVEASPLCPAQLSQSTCNGGTLPGVQLYTYMGTVTLPATCRDWVVSWSDGSRNSAVTNLASASSYDMYVEGRINNLDVTCNSSPDFTTPPVPYICAGVPFSYNHGVVDAEGDSLRYTMIQPLSAVGTPIAYSGSFTIANPMNTTAGLTFDPVTGQMSFTPNGTQVAAIAVRVDEYRNGVLIGSVIRDMQIVVISCTNNSPVAAPVSSLVGATVSGNVIYTCPGNAVSFSLRATDADITQILSSTHTITSNLPGSTVTAVGTNPRTLNVTWTVPVSPLPSYNFSVNFRDNACPVLGQTTIGYLVKTGASVDIVADSIYCAPSSTKTLTALSSGTGTYSWSPTTGLSCTNCANPTATITAPITYRVTYTDAGTGCRAVDTARITLHTMNLTVTPATPTWCAGSPAVAMNASLNGDNGAIITPSNTKYDLTSITPVATSTGTWTTVSLTDDAVSSAITIPFTFKFFGNNYTQFIISSNGFMSFDLASPNACCTGANIPSSSTPNNIISLAWNDLYPPGAGSVRYQTAGTAPNRRMIVQFNGIPHCCGTSNPVTGEMVLYETTNCIEIHTQSMPSDGDNHTMGIENATGTVGYAPTGRNAGLWSISTPEAWRYCPGNDTTGSVISYAWSGGSGISNAAIKNPTILPSSAPSTYTVTANDNVCTTTKSVTFTCPLLAVGCTDFVANYDNERVQLAWHTAQEENNRGFAIERSTNGIQFEQIGWVAGAGTTSRPQAYTYGDAHIQQGVMYYYRLVQYDIDGVKGQVCDVVNIIAGKSAPYQVAVRPNPAQTSAEVVLHSTTVANDVEIRLLDVFGKVVAIQPQLTIQQGINMFPLDLSRLSAGVYYVHIGNQWLGYSIQRLVKVE